VGARARDVEFYCRNHSAKVPKNVCSHRMPVLQNFRRGRGFRQVIEELKQPYECECSAGHSQSGLLGIHHARRAQELLLTGLTLSVIQHFTVEREPVRVFRATARLGVAPRAQRPLLRPLRPKCISTIRTKRPQSASPEKLVTADVTRRARRV
jgi:hypothetical protein